MSVFKYIYGQKYWLFSFYLINSLAIEHPSHGIFLSPDNNCADGSSNTIFHGIIPSADYLLTFIIPAVIITCMLILAILLACMLHKKRKAGMFDTVVIR